MKVKHSPTAMVRLCFALLLLYKQEYRIHMPRGFMDDLEGEVVGEEVHEGCLGEKILSADLDGEDELLPNIGEHCKSRPCLYLFYHTIDFFPSLWYNILTKE